MAARQIKYQSFLWLKNYLLDVKKSLVNCTEWIIFIVNLVQFMCINKQL